VKDAFLQFINCEFTNNGCWEVISEIPKTYPQLMRNIYMWWKKEYAHVGHSPHM